MSPIRSTKFGFDSLFADKVETDNDLVGIGATLTANDEFQPGNGHSYLVFTSPGYLYVNKTGQVDILIVGGGGAGGHGEFAPPTNRYAGSGGGAGGFFEKYQFTLPVGDYNISIGDGGAIAPTSTSGQPGTDRNGSPGTPSYISSPTITDLIAYGGGGGGGSFDAPGQAAGRGSDGGSGGGSNQGQTFGEGNRITATAPAFGSPIPSYLQGGGAVQGHPGANAPFTTTGGGGGGAGGAGLILMDSSRIFSFSGSPATGGVGRAAFADDPGIPPAYGTPGPTPGRYFAGGGGAGTALTPPFENGGAGGGGRGADGNPPNGTQDATAGTANTGGGGGGGHMNPKPGQPGGSGIVILRIRIS